MVAAVPPPAGRLVRLGVVVRGGPSEQSRLARMCDLAGVDVLWVADEQQAVELGRLVERSQVLVLPAAEEPWARTVPVSIGRTPAEAAARADMDPGLAGYGDLVDAGLYGTSGSAQRRSVTPAWASATTRACAASIVPYSPASTRSP